MNRNKIAALFTALVSLSLLGCGERNNERQSSDAASDSQAKNGNPKEYTSISETVARLEKRGKETADQDPRSIYKLHIDISLSECHLRMNSFRKERYGDIDSGGYGNLQINNKYYIDLAHPDLTIQLSDKETPRIACKANKKCIEANYHRFFSVTDKLHKFDLPTTYRSTITGFENWDDFTFVTMKEKDGDFQDRCHYLPNFYAACCNSFSGLSGFNVTGPTGSQFLTSPDQRFGFLAFAAFNTNSRLASIS